MCTLSVFENVVDCGFISVLFCCCYILSVCFVSSWLTPHAIVAITNLCMCVCPSHGSFKVGI